ncbi:MAG: sensor domain-containing diguanylate cyclase [Spirochaetales bacterium]|nr:MAG: sensor domain-containing diguanylate cyclase [Spirochaetales bacterium]
MTDVRTALFNLIAKGNVPEAEVKKTLLEYAARETDNSINTALLHKLIEEFASLSASLKESEARYRSVVTAMSEGIVLQDRSGAVITANESAKLILGPFMDQLSGISSADPRWTIIHEDGSPFSAGEHPAMETLATGEPRTGVIMGIHKSETDVSGGGEGDLTWISINAEPIFDPSAPEPAAVVTTFTDITERKNWEQQLKVLSVTDHLTGIFNRVKLSEELEADINRAKRYGTDLSLIMFDLDHFKRVNDSYGHDVGDKVLKAVVSVVQSIIRDTDLFARYGGEEFMVVLPHTDVGHAERLAERLRKASEGYEEPGLPRFTGSFGVTQYIPGDTRESLIKRTDEALYRAKNEGRNRVAAA